MNSTQLKNGDIVKLVTNYYEDDTSNPIWGGKYGNLSGVVIDLHPGEHGIRVKWSNNLTNVYRHGEVVKLDRVGPAHKLTTIFK